MHGKYIPSFFVAQWEPLLPGKNLYQRPKFNHFFVVEMENDIPTYQSYKKNWLTNVYGKYNKTNVVQYLMKWLKYGFEHDQWKKNQFSKIL